MAWNENQADMALVGRFFAGIPLDSDITQFSQRWATLIADEAGQRFSRYTNTNERLRLLQDIKQIVEKELRSLLASDDPKERVGPSLSLPVVFPELALSLGYDEVRFHHSRVVDPSVSESAQGVVLEGLSEQATLYGYPEAAVAILSGVYEHVHYRTPNGVWHNIEGVLDTLLPPQEKPGRQGEERSLAEWISLFKGGWIERYQQNEGRKQSALSLPALSLSAPHGDSPVHVAAKAVLRELQGNRKSLVDIHWRTLEEIVAELLHDLGMEVHITDRSGDGGRDVIARGELIPGEPTVLAVEVKHRKVVPVSEVRHALWANRHFPALLFVTSGRFSAGVYREQGANECLLRLYLKDGQGIRQWIDQYVRQSFGHGQP